MGVKPGLNIMDDTTPEGQILLKTWKAVIDAPRGPDQVYWGLEIENPLSIWAFFDWDSVEHHEKFAKSYVFNSPISGRMETEFRHQVRWRSGKRPSNYLDPWRIHKAFRHHAISTHSPTVSCDRCHARVLPLGYLASWKRQSYCTAQAVCREEPEPIL